MQSRQPVCNEPSQGYNLQDPMGHWLERMGPRDLLDSTRGLDLQAQGGCGTLDTPFGKVNCWRLHVVGRPGTLD